MEILQTYLPKELPVDEIKKMIEEVVAVTAPQGIKDMGKVMKEVTLRTAGARWPN